MRAERWWIIAAVGVPAVSLAARALARGVTQVVLVLDAVALLAGAMLIRAGRRRAAGLTPRGRRWQGGLAMGFVLGAVRAGLWAAGLPIQWANATALGLALVAALVWTVRRRRSASAGGRPRAGGLASR